MTLGRIPFTRKKAMHEWRKEGQPAGFRINDPLNPPAHPNPRSIKMSI